MRKICDALSANGYKLSVFSRSTVYSSDDYRVTPINCFFHQGFLAYAEFNFRLLLKLFMRRADKYSFVDLDTALPNWIVSKLSDKPLIYDAHEYYVESPEITDRKLIQLIWRGIARFIIPRADMAYTVNESLAKELDRRYSRSFDVIKNVPWKVSDRTDIDKQQEDYIILYQGVINMGRGLEEMINVMPRLPWAKLMIIGDGDITDRLKNNVEIQNLANVVFIEKQEPNTLRAFTKKAWIGINLLDISNKNYYYSLANKYFDYMQSAIPCISMNTPAYQALNIEYETSILIDDIDDDTIVKAIETLKGNNIIYDRLKANTKKAAEVYHWENEIPKLLSIYR